MSPKNKVGVYYDYQKNCTGSALVQGGEQCRDRGSDWVALGSIGGFGSLSPESGNVWDDREKIFQSTWSSPMTSKLLLEAGFSSFNSRWGGQIPAGAQTGRDRRDRAARHAGDAGADWRLRLSRLGVVRHQRSAAQRVARVGAPT